MGSFAQYLGSAHQSLGAFLGLPWGVHGDTCKMFGRISSSLGDILGQLPWEVLGEVLQVAWGIAARCMGSFATCFWSLHQIQGAFLGDCLGESLGKYCNLPGRFLHTGWGCLHNVGGALTKNCGDSQPISLRSDWGSLAICLGGLGRVLGEFCKVRPKPWSVPEKS